MQISAKEIASLLRTLSRTANKPHFTSAVIAAGGSGTRMGNDGTTAKQHMELAGMPIIVRTLKAFQEAGSINEIIVVIRGKDELDIYDGYIKNYGLTKVSGLIFGGKTRQESVLNGFEAISDSSDFVAIHDGARCLITPEMIDAVMFEAFRKGAATAATRVTDTVKRSDRYGFITETVERDDLWLAQTPQAFKTELYRAAAYVCKEEGFTSTDDNALAEHVGFRVKLVDCGTQNLKITTKTDLVMAEAILASRK